MRFQRRHDLTGSDAQRVLKGISRISGLAEVAEDTVARIWIRGEPHSVREFLHRVYGEAAMKKLADNERELGIGLYSETGEDEEKGEKGEKGGESI